MTAPLQIILVDPSPVIRRCTRLALASHTITAVSTLQEGLHALARPDVDVVVSDWILADGCAASLLEAAEGCARLRIVHAVDPPAPREAPLADLILRVPAWQGLRRAIDELAARPSADADAARRRDTRTSVRLPVFVSVGDWVRRLYSCDVSAYGISVASSEPLATGASLRVIVPRSHDPPLEFEAEVRHCTVLRPATWRVGLSLRSPERLQHVALAGLAVQRAAATRDRTTTS